MHDNRRIPGPSLLWVPVLLLLWPMTPAEVAGTVKPK